MRHEFFNSPEVAELLNAIPHGIAVLDVNLCIVSVNRFLEAMTGYSVEAARGVYGEYILRPNLGNKDQVCRTVFDSGESMSFDGNIINRQRKKIPIHFIFSRLHDEQGRPAGILVVLEDISFLQAKGATVQGRAVKKEIIGNSRQLEEIFELVSVLARTDASVLITGETGTGKDMIAEALHNASRRARHPFIKVNCGALPETLLESELFGHVKGAFTGAVKDAVGMFRLAHKGTIFLTEIGDLSLPLQVKLLSVLDDQEFYPVGAGKKVKVDVRIIAATHRTLRQEVQQGRFREDLFYRLNVLRLHMPPLREREGDVRLLLDHFIRQFSAGLGRNITDCTANAADTLERYSYPGNVRELRNIVEYAVNICQGDKIGCGDLPKYLFRPVEPVVSSPAAMTSATESVPHQPQSVDPVPSGWAEVEREMIIDALRKVGGNRSKAAGILGWGRTTLWRKLNKYGLN